ncbi:hypothetical protein ACHAQA_009050 [Verticillium albo-atrum]
MGIPRQPPSETSFDMPSFNQGPTSATAAAPPRNFKTAGRKRSRDEAAPNLVEDAPAQEIETGWEYGEGMVLIKPVQGYVADASSQSGTWVEEKTTRDQAAKAAASTVDAPHRPEMRSNKSQRLDQSTIPSPGMALAIDANGIIPTNSAPESSTGFSASCAQPADNTSHPVVDDFTLHLGIGWRKISEDEHIQAAARGWSRYIENHYPLSSVTLRLESRGLQAYLVEAAEGFFLFAEDLRQGQLVSKKADTALQNLKCSPPVFEGTEILTAAESPGATTNSVVQAFQVGLQPDTEMN